MFFREVLNEDLGCDYYIVADGGEAAVIDSKWGIEECLNQSGVGTRAAWVLDPETEVIVTAEGDEYAQRAIRGYPAGGINAWLAAGLEVGTTLALDMLGLAERIKREEIVVLDVRDPAE
jgi:hydroxyacylglutathione hydrolase